VGILFASAAIPFLFLFSGDPGGAASFTFLMKQYVPPSSPPSKYTVPLSKYKSGCAVAFAARQIHRTPLKYKSGCAAGFPGRKNSVEK
jgi:hypothetical protein